MAMRLSLVCSLAATAISIVLGLPLAWVLARTVRFPGRSLLRALTLPPWCCRRSSAASRCSPSSAGAGCSASASTRWDPPALHHRRRDPGRDLRRHAVLRLVDGGRRSARSTGGSRTRRGPSARRWTVFRRVTAAAACAPSLAAGAVLCWARALGEFGATITFAGNFPGRTQTMPLAVYIELESVPRPAGPEPRAAGGLAGRPRRPARALARTPVSLEARVRLRARRPSRSTSTCRRGRRDAWRCSDRTAPARPRCCGRWPGSSRSTRDASPSTAARSTIRRRASPSRRRSAPSASCSRTTSSSRTCRRSTTWRSGCAATGVPRREADGARHLARAASGSATGRAPAGALSGGQAQRVALARALAVEPTPAAARRAARRGRRPGTRRAAPRAAQAPGVVRRRAPAGDARSARGVRARGSRDRARAGSRRADRNAGRGHRAPALTVGRGPRRRQPASRPRRRRPRRARTTATSWSSPSDRPRATSSLVIHPRAVALLQRERRRARRATCGAGRSTRSTSRADRPRPRRRRRAAGRRRGHAAAVAALRLDEGERRLGHASRRPRSLSTRDEASLADHHLGRLDDRHHGVARLEPEALDRCLRDHRRPPPDPRCRPPPRS